MDQSDPKGLAFLLATTGFGLAMSPIEDELVRRVVVPFSTSFAGCSIKHAVHSFESLALEDELFVGHDPGPGTAHVVIPAVEADQGTAIGPSNWFADELVSVGYPVQAVLIRIDKLVVPEARSERRLR